MLTFVKPTPGVQFEAEGCRAMVNRPILLGPFQPEGPVVKGRIHGALPMHEAIQFEVELPETEFDPAYLQVATWQPVIL